MPAVNLAFNTRNNLRDVFGSHVPNFNTALQGGVLNIHPDNVVGNNWRFNAITNQYLAIPNNHSIQFTLAPQSNLRYLPWQPDTCTGMELDNAASVFVTGPLNGCSFMMARDPNSNNPVILHANSNQHPGQVAARNTAQLTNATQYLNIFHNNAQVSFETQYERDMRNHQGWIIGTDVHGDQSTWQIYCVTDEHVGGFRPNYFNDLGVCQLQYKSKQVITAWVSAVDRVQTEPY